MIPLFRNESRPGEAEKTSSMFWTVTFPRLVCAEPVIAKCLIVLVTSHEKVQSSDGPFALEPECLERFIEAITLLRKDWTSMSVDCILIASIVLAIAELSFGPSPSGLSHLYAGSKIIEQRRAHPEDYAHHRSSPEIEGIRESIELLYEAFFASMDREKESLVPAEGRLHDIANASDFSLPLKFTSTQQALQILETLTTTAFSMHENDPTDLDPDSYTNGRTKLRQSAEDWLGAFQDLEADLNCTTDPEFLKACLIIRITGLTTLIMSSSPTSEVLYSQHRAEFLQIADFSEEFLKIGGGMTQSVKAHLIHGIGPVNPVFFAATKCRLPAIRKRLLKALRRFKVAEGLWTSCAAYQVAHQVAEIEDNLTEAGPSPTATAWSNPIKLESVTFDGSKHMDLKYARESGADSSIALNSVVAIRPCRHQSFFNQVNSSPLAHLGTSNIFPETS